MTSERVLASAFLSKLASRCHGSRVSAELVLREVDVRTGVADIVKLRIRGTSWLSASNPAVRALTEPGLARTYTCLEAEEPATTERIATRLGLARSTIRRQLSRLSRVGLVRRVGGTEYCLTCRMPYRGTFITAYEAKISNWKRALYQARRYHTFADRVYLVMPIARARRLETRSVLVRTARVGLIGVNDDGTSIKLLRAPASGASVPAIRLRVVASAILSERRHTRSIVPRRGPVPRSTL